MSKYYNIVIIVSIILKIHILSHVTNVTNYKDIRCLLNQECIKLAIKILKYVYIDKQCDLDVLLFAKVCMQVFFY